MKGKLLAYGLLVLPPLFWAGNFVTGRYISDQVPAMSLSYWRWTLAMLIAMPLLYSSMWRQRAVIKANWLRISTLACLGVAGFNSCVYIGLQSTTATNALIINSMIPIFILLVSWLALKQKISARQLLGIGLSFVGVLALLVKGQWQQLASLSINQGDAWIVLSSLVWALYSIGLRFKPADLGGAAFLGCTLVVGSLVLSPFYWLNLPQAAFNLSSDAMAALAYVAIFPSLLAYLAWNYGVKIVGANLAGQYIHLMPLFGAVLSVSFLGEQLAAYHALGAMFIAAGLLVALLPFAILRARLARFKAH
ncbi:multidrug DMT transporter permease [Agarivorans sp. Toyoura001]|uniref:DMT family transporter n=1 Tax=Agarivorans sp. Toyoura001 TaxID=2283141 RepID=UPI0010E2D24A|nr:DMT family transporter [Agarivorans sp. Toyoura001]GDY25287.1 multidrug DMT transporter permease [Agarivorans sp. Toyoura001]